MRHLLFVGLLCLPIFFVTPAGQPSNTAATTIPPPKPSTMLLVGGGHTSNRVRQKFVELAGGDHAHIVIIPTASSEPNLIKLYRQAWRNHASHITFLHTTSRSEANDKAFCACLRQATGVWIGGGDQKHFMDIYGDTLVEKEIEILVRRGGILGGTSAGASLPGGVMPFEDSMERGLGLLENIIVDQHFDRRRRLPRLLSLLESHPDHLGLGLDEGTAILIVGDKVTVFDGNTASVCKHGKKPQIYHAGQQFCLK